MPRIRNACAFSGSRMRIINGLSKITIMYGVSEKSVLSYLLTR